MKYDKIVFWTITPPNNMTSFIQAVNDNWTDGVALISCHAIREERKRSGFSSSFQWLKEYYVLDEQLSKESFVINYINNNKNAIHVFCGIRREPSQYMYLLKTVNPEAKIVTITEKPANKSGKGIQRLLKRFFLPLSYRHTIQRVEKVANVMFVCSLHGLDFFKKQGWKKKNIFNFMYCDSVAEKVEVMDPSVGTKVKFLYVGRFDYKMRGVDVIMKAFENLGGEWQLDLVGGYGNNADEVIKWAEEHNSVNYLGRWPNNEVGRKMKDYDIYICASKEDSWNGQINLAISSGLSVLTSSEAGSDELVKYGKTGRVLPAGDVNALRNALEYTIANHDAVQEWKKNSERFKNKITPDAVGNYFLNVVKNSFYGESNDSKCPWITKRIE